MKMHVPGQSRSAASAEIHADIEAVGFDCQREDLLRFPDELGQLQKFGVGRLIEVGKVPGRCNQHVAVIIWIAIQYDDAFVRSPEYEVLAVLLRMIEIMADKTFVLFGNLAAVFIGLGFFVQTLDIINSPRCP